MLDEHSVLAKWRKLFHESTINDNTVIAAEELLRELPPESPLGVRLGAELDEICRLRKLKRKIDDLSQ